MGSEKLSTGNLELDRVFRNWLEIEEMDSCDTPISKNQKNYWYMPDDLLAACAKSKLNRLEGFLLTLIIGFESGWINTELSKEVPSFSYLQKEIFQVIDAVLKKLPRTNGQMVYRMDVYSFNLEEAINWWKSKLGCVVEIPFYLGTSLEEWSDEEVIWRIRTLTSRSHGCIISDFHNQADEKEVRFKRGAKFQVDKIHQVSGKRYVELSEVNSETQTDAFLYSNSYSSLIWKEEGGDNEEGYLD